jgi:hypothetical protein
MTLAIDKTSNEVIGQVLDPITDAMPATWALVVLTRDGVRTMRRCDVRLEVVR